MKRILTTFFVLGVLLGLAACADDVTDPPAKETLIDNGSFEASAGPTLGGWKFGNADLARSVQDAPPGGGAWCLELTADWAPTSGYAFAHAYGVRSGDVLRLSCYVRAVGPTGGGAIELRIASRVPVRAESRDTLWTLLQVADTVRQGEEDSVEVRLTSLITEIVPRRGLFDLVRLERVP